MIQQLLRVSSNCKLLKHLQRTLLCALIASASLSVTKLLLCNQLERMFAISLRCL